MIYFVLIIFSFQNLSLSHFPGLNDTSHILLLREDWPLTTNVSCVAEKMDNAFKSLQFLGELGEGEEEVALERSSSLQTDMNLTDVFSYDMVESCPFKMPEAFPANSGIWFQTIFVALLGALQQFCLIGKALLK